MKQTPEMVFVFVLLALNDRMMGVTTLPIRVRGVVEIHFPNIFKKIQKNLDILGKESMINCELLNKYF